MTNTKHMIEYGSQTIVLDKQNVQIKRTEKIYSRDDGITKGEILEYYIKAAPLLLPHLRDRPFSMIHFPEGVGGKSFYQKECPKDAPDFVETVALPSSRKGEINWCMVNNPASIIYMANRSVIEMHTWFSRVPDLSRPDVAVIDLDPSGNTGFAEAAVIAKAFELLLAELKLYAVPKTSGGRGIHIHIPIKPIPFEEVQSFLVKLCKIVADAYPKLATLERTVSKRGNKIYLDAVQNGGGKTITAPYSLRARKKLPVATPLFWDELDSKTINPSDYNISNIFERLADTGDLFKDFYKKRQILPRFQ